MLQEGINIIEWPSLQYCTMSAFGEDALQRKAMSHKSSFIIIDDRPEKYGTSFEYQEKETGLLWTCKKASFPKKISVGGQGGTEKEAEGEEERVGLAT